MDACCSVRQVPGRQRRTLQIVLGINLVMFAVELVAGLLAHSTALLADSQVKGTQINVDSNNGIVTLSGSVATASEKMRAEQLAHNVDGVKAVTNNLAAPQ